ncbi:MAG TPA: Y-family DNA polymerase [Victivallales bacterium]|nr:Y-family DNA polymerase [Victivallales bacterium]
MKYIALVDCDSYYCSCERIFAPDLNKRPVIVLSNNDGCAVALTPEAKAAGIKVGDPYYQIKGIIKKHNIAVFSSNYELYGDISKRIFMILKEFTPDIENYSIDESFLKLDNSNRTIEEICQDIVYRTKSYCSIPVKCGVSNTKTLCKVAADLVKKQKIKSKYKILLDPDETLEILKEFPVEDVWGIGRQLTKKLKSRGVNTAAKFVRLDDDYIRRNFSINLLRTKWELEGRPSIDMELVPQTRKNHCHSRTFGNAISEKKDLKESIVSYTSTAAANIRGMKLKAQSISVYIRTNFFNKDLPQYSNSITIALPYPANDTMTLVKYAIEGFERIFREGYLYKKSSILLNDLVDEIVDQPNFFVKSDPANDRLSKVMDQINNEYGKGTIKIASTGIKKQKWQLQRNLISSRYTTRFEELFKI